VSLRSPLSRRATAVTATACVLLSGGLVLAPSAGAADAGTVINIVDFNDFHGRIDANTLKFAGTVEQLRAAGGADNTLLMSAGDNVSASLFASAVADDQPTIDVLNALDLQVSAVGNHEFDKGYSDLVDRIIAPPPGNAKWDYLGANVYEKGTSTPALKEYSIVEVAGIKVGIIGAVTQETSTLVSPGGISTVDFGDPVDAVNRVAAQLTDGDRSNGEADLLIADYHEGAAAGENAGSTLDAELAKGGAFAKIVNSTSAKVAAIFTAHTHQRYSWDGAIPGEPGRTRPVLQAASYGEYIGNLKLTVDPATKKVTAYSSTDVARTTVDDATLIATYPRVAAVKPIVDAALANAAKIGNQKIADQTTDITTAYLGGSYTGPGNTYVGPNAADRTAGRDDRSKESTLGNLVADSLLASLSADDRGGAEIGVVNPGGLRAELLYPSSTVGEGDGVTTYAEANSVLPFVNNLWTTTLTGAQVKTMLEQQWQTDAAGNVPSRPYLQLGLSKNISYTFDANAAQGNHITSITVNGKPIDAAANYRIGTFSFLTTGGDNFRVLAQGKDARDSGLIDRDAWIDYLKGASPVAPSFAKHGVGVTGLPTAAVAQGGTVTLNVSNLDLTSLGAPANSTVQATWGTGAAGGTTLGSFAVKDGAATVAVKIPANAAVGAGTLTLTAAPSGTVVSLPVTVKAATVSKTKSYTGLIQTRSSQKYGSSQAALVAMPVTPNSKVIYPVPGKITFKEGSKVLATLTVSRTGQATYKLPATTSVGTHKYTAVFTPSAASVAGSTSNTVAVTVTK
jgi:5'-nucleotidase